MFRPFLVVATAAVLYTTLAARQQTKPKPAAKPPATKTTTPKTVTPATPAPAPKPEPPPTDVRLKTSYTQGAQISQNVMYLHGARQRMEFPGVVSIAQCDLNRSVMLNAAAKKFRVQPYAGRAGEASTPTPTGDPSPMSVGTTGRMGAPTGQPHGGVVTLTTTLTDTLERQTMLGLEARHVKTVINKQSTPTACDKTPMKIEMDAWYVDLPAQATCNAPAPPPPSDPSSCTDRMESRTVGDAKLGFPVKVTTTTTTGEGDKVEAISSSQVVTELEITRLDPALFEIPAGYTEATSSAELMPALATGGSLAEALFGSTVDGSSAAAPKKAGAVRIGILEPINRTPRTLQASALRNDLVGKFSKAPYEAIPVAGTSPGAIDQEAARLECDYLLLTEITEAKSSPPSKLGGVMRKAGGGGPVKDTQEAKLDYKLFSVGATQAPRLSGNAKASSGGFTVGSALRVAAFAGQTYMTMGMMGGMGMGMMNPMIGMGLSNAGALGSMAGSYFDPRASAMSSMAMGLGGGMMPGGGMRGMPGGDPSENDMRDTLSEALGNAAKSTMEQLANKKK
jgi:hypothetical protein